MNHQCDKHCAHTISIETPVCLWTIYEGYRTVGWCDRPKGHDGNHSVGILPAPNAVYREDQ